MADHRLPKLAFHEVPIEEFLTARQQGCRRRHAACSSHPGGGCCGLERGPVSGLRMNSVTGEFDDRHFVHVGPRRRVGREWV
jgi:hypothetical protein